MKSKKRTKSQFETHVKIGKISIPAQIDSGSGVNVLDVKTKLLTINLKRSKTKLLAYGTNTPHETLGCFGTSLESDKRFVPVTMYVAKKGSGNLLSGDTAIDLGLLNLNKINKVTADANQPTSIGSDKQDVDQNKPLNQTLADDSKAWFPYNLCGSLWVAEGRWVCQSFMITEGLSGSLRVAEGLSRSLRVFLFFKVFDQSN